VDFLDEIAITLAARRSVGTCRNGGGGRFVMRRSARAAIEYGRTPAVAREFLKRGGLIAHIALWIIQTLLALLFLFAGGMKFVMSIEEMTKQMAMPGWFLHFIGVCEVLGALGLILPWLTRIRPGLTPLAAAGLVIIMIGATVTTLTTGSMAMALIPLVVGVLAAFVAYGRWRQTPQSG
jgi:uncharacterized membrane protein YphA (DoxX/SURF4 family)